jgi:pimeloyl-ACP methyl ester carboxylesterase
MGKGAGVSADQTFVVHGLGGRGAPLLICHATGFCGQAYLPLAELLAQRHQVFAIDFRGHGDAPSPGDHDYSWPCMAREVAAAASIIGDAPLHLVGHSMGAAAGLAAAAAAPDMFASAFMFEPIVVGGPVAIPLEQNPMAATARRRTQVFESKQAALDNFSSKPPLDQLSGDSLAAYVEYGLGVLPDGRAFLKCSGESEALTYEATGQISTLTIGGAELPTVIATGNPTTSMLATLAPAIVEGLSNARHLVYPELGHFGPLQAPHRIARDVLEHIEATTGSTR